MEFESKGYGLCVPRVMKFESEIMEFESESYGV